MNDITLPAPIRAFIEATNAADTEAFVKTFTTDAYLHDFGRSFHGLDGARSWDRTDNIGVQAHFDALDVAPGTEPDSFVVTMKVTGNGFNGVSPMTFTVRDGLISSMVID